MRISVALCTFNGARYLDEQLSSILAQTRQPDEVVIGDDGSTDATHEIAARFSGQAGFSVVLLAGTERLGSTANFERTIRHCNGDLIALSDQDDCWRPERLERLAAVFEARPEAALVFSDGALMDEQSHPLPGSLWQRFGLAGEPLRRFASGDYSLLCRGRFVTGATAMLRRVALADALPIPCEWVHDAWLATVLSFHGDLVALDEPLIDYRVHSQQQVGVRSLWQRRATREAAAHWERIHRERLQADALATQLSAHPPALRQDLLPLYRERAEFLRFRDALPPQRLQRIASVFGRWQRYRAQAGGVPSALKDALLPRPLL